MIYKINILAFLTAGVCSGMDKVDRLSELGTPKKKKIR